MVDSILAHIPGTRIFASMGIVQEYSKYYKISLLYRPNLEKINDSIFSKFKKPCFWPIFPIFRVKKIFLGNSALSCPTSCGFLAPCQNLEKVNDTIQRKCLDRRKDGKPYFIGQSLFYRTTLATAGGPKSFMKLCTFFLFFSLKA